MVVRFGEYPVPCIVISHQGIAAVVMVVGAVQKLIFQGNGAFAVIVILTVGIHQMTVLESRRIFVFGIAVIVCDPRIFFSVSIVVRL